MLVKMSDDKQSTGEPTVVFATSQTSGSEAKSLKSRLTKKHVLIAATILLVTGLVVVAVLVSVRMVTDNNLEVLKYTLKANGVSQNVSVNGNVVTYHIVKGDVEAWIVDDFDKDIKVTKMLADGKASCYVMALNRSSAEDATSIPSTAPEAASSAPSSSALYQVMADPISDISYLGRKVSDMCQNIPTYHAVPHCGNTMDNKDNGLQNVTSPAQRSKRTPAICATCNLRNCQCACGCCTIVCGRFASYYYYTQYVNGVWRCTYYMYTVYAAQSLPFCRYSGIYYNP